MSRSPVSSARRPAPVPRSSRCGGPGGEELERLVRGAAGGGRIHREGMSGVLLQSQHLVIQFQQSHRRMPEELGPGVMAADIVRSPQRPEFLAAHRQLAHQFGDALVVRVPARLAAQDGNVGVGCPVPVGVEIAGPRVQEDEAGVVCRPDGAAVHVGVERVAQRVGRHDVQPVVAYEGGRFGDGVQEVLQLRAHPGRDGRRNAFPARGVGRPGKIVEMVVLCPVQFQGPCNRIQHTVGHARKVPALQPGVVVHADPGQPGHFLTPQPGHAPAAPVGLESRLLGRDASTAGGKELPDFGSVIHRGHVTTDPESQGWVCQNQLQQGPRYGSQLPV